MADTLLWGVAGVCLPRRQSGQRAPVQVGAGPGPPPASTSSLALSCKPAGDPAEQRRRLGAYLGLELFQKTVWRSAAARLQHNPRSGAQRNSMAGRAGCC